MPRSRFLLQRASAKSGAAKREREKEWGRRECIKGEKGEKRPLDARKNGKSLNNSRLNAHTHTRTRKGERESEGRGKAKYFAREHKYKRHTSFTFAQRMRKQVFSFSPSAFPSACECRPLVHLAATAREVSARIFLPSPAPSLSSLTCAASYTLSFEKTDSTFLLLPSDLHFLR